MAALKDLTGKIYGRLTVLNRSLEMIRKRPAWNCICECGKFIISASSDLISGDKKSCGCLRKDLLRVDLSGKRFGKLIALEYLQEKKGKSSSQVWKCRCDCGNDYLVTSQHLLDGYVKSCGCIKLINFNKYKNEFFENIEKTETCWNWKGRISGKNKRACAYGIFFAEKMIMAHRFSYILHKGKIEKNKLICHTCDNPICVNPDHLYSGTHKTNANDRENRGRGVRRKSLKER